MFRFLPLLLALGTSGCLLEPNGSAALVTGDWGGPHLGMIATDSAASLEFDCALGTIPGPIRTDVKGAFSVTGLFFPGFGGPLPMPSDAESHPARYDGVVRGDKMTLTVTLTDSNTSLGTYTLLRGGSPYVVKCV